MLPLVGVGLLYQNGYLQQSLDPGRLAAGTHAGERFLFAAGDAGERDPNGEELLVSVMLSGARVFLKVWRIDVGRVKLYLLDSNIPQNADPAASRDHQPALRRRSAHAHPAGNRPRHRRAARAEGAGARSDRVSHERRPLGISRRRTDPGSHDGGPAVLRGGARRLASNNVFTTHTSVPAGIDLFDAGLMYEYFNEYCENAGIGFDQLLSLGRRDPPRIRNEPFSMAVAAIKTSAFRNAVSRLHRRVSQEMWEGLWPKLPHVGSADHLRHQRRPSADLDQWRSGRTLRSVSAARLARGTRRRRRSGSRSPTSRTRNCGKPTGGASGGWLPSCGSARWPGPSRARLRHTKSSGARKCSIPETFTIGFARRFATYKRATLLFRDLARLKRILTNPEMPVQIVIAGKAHPKDIPGKSLIREIVQFSRDPELAGTSSSSRTTVCSVAPGTGAGRRPLAEHAAPRRRSLRHQRHEGRHQRRAQSQHPRRLVRRSLRGLRRLGHRRPRTLFPGSG